MADIIVTTVSNTGDTAIYLFGFQVIPHSGRQSQLSPEPNMWNVLGNYNPAALVMIGNKKQLPPLVMSKPENNDFVNLLHFLLFR